MRISSRRGQFQIMAAFMVLAIVTAATVTAFNRIQDNPFKEPVTLASEIQQVNTALHELLGFTSGYYGSIIKLTGNVTYAKEKVNSYFVSGIDTIAHSDLKNGISLTFNDMSVRTNWFGKKGFTSGILSVEYSIPSIGLYGIKYHGSASLSVTIQSTVGDVSEVQVLGDNDEPNLSLTKSSFTFFKFDNSRNEWVYLSPPSDPEISNSGIYLIELPPGINRDTYFLQVVDQRGIMVSSSYVRGSGDSNKAQPSFTYTFSWDPNYNTLNEPNLEIELLQNGTLRWLGQSLTTIGSARPIPPVPVKGIHLNETINGVNQEVPFQIEDWGANYRVPLGMTSNSTILNENCMIVFLVNHHVSKVTLWWDGSDEAVQTPYAYRDVYFTRDNPSSKTLDNGVITLDLSHFSGNNGYVKSITRTNPIASNSTYLRVNGRTPTYGSDPSYTIHHGVVRDIVQQEPEWSGGVSSSPDFYGQVVLTLPAGANYYTYRSRVMYVETSMTRNLNQLSVFQLKSASGYSQLTEDGVQGTTPKTSTGTLFYNGGTAYQHQWSEYISSNKGVGLMTRSLSNGVLYSFDDVVGQKTGAVSIDTTNRRIELNPVQRFPVNGFQRSADLTWVGAIINFSSGNSVDTIYPSSGGSLGLWVLVENPPTVIIG